MRRIIPLGRAATWDDLDQVPEHLVGEIVDGELVVTPHPDPPHMHTASVLGALLIGPQLLRDGIRAVEWRVYRRAGIQFGRDIRVPDLAGWRRERWSPPRLHGPVRVTPDWVCEVLSPSTVKEDRTAKMRLYRRHGVRHLWLIGPLAQTLEVYRGEEPGWFVAGTFGGTERVRAEPFDAIELDLSLLWGEVADDDEPDDEDAEA